MAVGCCQRQLFLAFVADLRQVAKSMDEKA
jgi:hypothetical protein